MALPPLQPADGGSLDLEAMITALADRFDVVSGSRRLVRREQLDTFDRRLRAAGLRLEHVTSGTDERLLLTGQDASPHLGVPVKAPRWPALAGALPSGPVRDAVAPVSGIRALIALSDERRHVRLLELHNEDGKTVVRVELDEPAGRHGSPPEVTVQPLRGYDGDARRARRLIKALGLAEPAEEPGAEQVPGTADADPEAPATTLLAGQLGLFLGSMNDNLQGVLDDADTEFLHDFRVAVRRTRSTLKLGRPVLAGEMRSHWEPAFKWLGDLTTPVRDLDVYQLGLPAMSEWLVAADPSDLGPFEGHLRRHRAAERRRLLRGLRSQRFQRQLSEWSDVLAELGAAPPETGRKQLSAKGLADLSIRQAHRRVVRGGAAISVDSPAGDLHSLRKRSKELRYALEVFTPVIAKAPRKAAVSDLKALQDVLGRFQDSEVQRHALRGFADEMMADGTPAGALLAMGELIGHLDADQDQARREFDTVFAQFVRPASTARMRRLWGGK